MRGLGVEVTTFPRYGNDISFSPTGALNRKCTIKTLIKRYGPSWSQPLFIELALIAQGLWNSLQFWFLARKLKASPPDVIYGRVFYCDWGPWLVGRTLSRPVILEVHSPHYLERMFRGWRKSHALRTFERLQWRHAAFIRVVSKPVIKIMEGEGVDPDRIRFIPYGVNILPQRSTSHTTKKSHLKIIFVGSFYSWHGVATLLRAFAQAKKDIPDAHLELIGDGCTLLADKQLASALGIEDTVTFRGWLPHNSMLDHIRLADIAVAPFLHIEPFYFDPVKILDYMSTGVAIIASRLDRIAQILQEGRGGLLVPPGDIAALATAMTKLGQAPRLRNQLGSGAQEILHEEGYAWETTAQRTKALCAEAAELSSL